MISHQRNLLSVDIADNQAIDALKGALNLMADMENTRNTRWLDV